MRYRHSIRALVIWWWENPDFGDISYVALKWPIPDIMRAHVIMHSLPIQLYITFISIIPQYHTPWFPLASNTFSTVWHSLLIVSFFAWFDKSSIAYTTPCNSNVVRAFSAFWNIHGFNSRRWKVSKMNIYSDRLYWFMISMLLSFMRPNYLTNISYWLLLMCSVKCPNTYTASFYSSICQLCTSFTMYDSS